MTLGPTDAIAEGRRWVESGEFSMAVIRKASLDAHAAAKETDDVAAIAAAHAAGQAVATAHVPQHAYGGSYYALRAIAAHSSEAEKVETERDWQAARLPSHLRDEIMDRIELKRVKTSVKVSVRKGEGF